MILQFTVSNFRCFRGIQTLNLTASADASLPENRIDLALPGLGGKRWLKGTAIYGANASGKSTVLEALQALRELVINSAKATDARDPITQIEPFALCPGQEAPPTAFGIVFVADGIRYEYRVAATRERIWHESLRAFPKAKEQTWFARDWNPDTSAYDWSPEKPVGFQRDTQLEGYTLSNTLYLSKSIASNRTKLEPVFRWFKDRLRFIDLSTRSVMGGGFTLKQIHEKTSFYPGIVELLRHADLGVTGATAIEERPSSEEIENLVSTAPAELRDRIRKQLWLQPVLTHRGSGDKDVPLPWPKESAGTHRLFALAGPWLDILKQGYVACIDELETSMHPLMVRELLRLFFSAGANTGNAQIIFTTHNPLLLDTTLMRRDQIWFTDKDEEGAAHLYPLTDYSPRKGESLVRGYLSGRYGAVPFVPEGLVPGESSTSKGQHD